MEASFGVFPWHGSLFFPVARGAAALFRVGSGGTGGGKEFGERRYAGPFPASPSYSRNSAATQSLSVIFTSKP